MINRGLVVFLFDLSLALLAWTGAYWLRFNLDIPREFWRPIVTTLGVVIPVQAVVFYGFGLYRGLWRFASVSDLKRILMAGGVAGLATPVALIMTRQMDSVLRTVLLLDPLLLIVFMGGVRFTYRAWKDGHFFLQRTGIGVPVLIIGGGESAASLLRDLSRSQDWRVVGIVEPDSGRVGRQVGSVPIVGGLEKIAEHARRADAGHAIIAMPSATVAERRHAAELAAAAGLSVLTVPALDDLLAGRVSISSVRKVELEDLLGRDRIELDEAGLAGLLGDRVVLVTGAGGSIGSELCRQIARYAPRRIVFFEQSEFALYAIEQEFAGGAVVPAIGDVKDSRRLESVFAEHAPEVVFHAAAYKHVPLMENANAWEAVRNNVAGTLAVARTAVRHGVCEFVLISTDKAVNPTNVMGATKRLAEMACQGLQAAHPATRFVSVRFGNVLGSSGSVIPLFREQIARGGPVTVTHPDIIRYFMLIPEAAQLVLQAGLMAAHKAEGGEIFVLDMGEPVRIVDLARDMIRLSGFSEDDIRIEFTGLRPGEKLFEELLADGEATLATPHPKLRIARPTSVPDAAWLADLDAWLQVDWRDEAAVKDGLRQRVPEYRPAAH